MKKLEVVETITVCQHYVTALYYGDFSGLENSEEIESVKTMIENIGTKTLDVIEGSENFSVCDISGLRGDTVEINLLDWVESEDTQEEIEIDSENYFDIAEAIHCFCSLNHEGQGSVLYSILSRSEFRPGPLWSESIVEKENFYFPQITESNVEKLFDSLEKFLKEKEN